MKINFSISYSKPFTRNISFVILLMIFLFQASKIDAQLSFDANPVCFGEKTAFTATLPEGVEDSIIQAYQWDMDNDGYWDDATGKNPEYEFSRADTFPVSLRIIYKGEQENDHMEEPRDVVVHPLPEANFTADFLCLHSKSILKSTSDSSLAHYWDIGDDGTTEKENIYSFFYQLPDSNPVVNLQVINKYGCTASQTKELHLNTPPKADFSYSDIQCPGDTMSLTNSTQLFENDSAAYKWKFDNAVIKYEEEPNHVYKRSGEHQVTLIAITEDNCSDTISKSFQLSPGTKLTLTTQDSVLYNGESTEITAEGNFNSYEWSSGDSTSSIITNQGGTYDVTAIDNRGCFSYDTIRIKSYPGLDPNKIIAINSVLTPNDDGINDFLEFKNIDAYENCKIYIYNQWGFLMYQSDDYQNNWSGVDEEGDLLKTGTYFYTIKSKNAMGKGSINILRRNY